MSTANRVFLIDIFCDSFIYLNLKALALYIKPTIGE